MQLRKIQPCIFILIFTLTWRTWWVRTCPASHKTRNNLNTPFKAQRHWPQRGAWRPAAAAPAPLRNLLSNMRKAKQLFFVKEANRLDYKSSADSHSTPGVKSSLTGQISREGICGQYQKTNYPNYLWVFISLGSASIFWNQLSTCSYFSTQHSRQHLGIHNWFSLTPH